MASSTPTEKLYPLEEIKFFDEKVTILLQNSTSSSPFLALCNVLILQKRISLPPSNIRQVQESQLIDIIVPLCTSLNHSDTVKMLKGLASGITFDVKFTGITDYVSFPELAIFDALDIKVCHGWLVDPKDQDVALAVRDYSYTELTNKMAALNSDENELSLKEGESIGDFLKKTKRQLTKHGLSELRKELNDNELVVFYRKKQFSTLHKWQGKLYFLTANRAFLSDLKLVWEMQDEGIMEQPINEQIISLLVDQQKEVIEQVNLLKKMSDMLGVRLDRQQAGVEQLNRRVINQEDMGKQLGVRVKKQEDIVMGDHQLGVGVKKLEDGVVELKRSVGELSHRIKDLKNENEVKGRREKWVIGAVMVLGSLEMARRLRKMFK